MNDHPSFFTATCLEWKKLLKLEKYKDIVIESLRFLVVENRINLYGFAVMDNHIYPFVGVIHQQKRIKTLYL